MARRKNAEQVDALEEKSAAGCRALLIADSCRAKRQACNLFSLEQLWKRLRAFLLYRLQGGRIESQSLKNARGYLHGCDWDGYSFSPDAGICHQQHHVCVVVGETAMFSQLLGASGICDSDMRSDQNVDRKSVV